MKPNSRNKVRQSQINNFYLFIYLFIKRDLDFEIEYEFHGEIVQETGKQVYQMK